MKTMFVLISHPMTEEQKSDARTRYGVERFVRLETDVWSAIPADADSVLPYVRPLFARLEREAKEGDLLFVQGDFGATFAMVQFAYGRGMLPVYATTERDAVEKVDGERVITTRVFRHVRFRAYERLAPNEGGSS